MGRVAQSASFVYVFSIVLLCYPFLTLLRWARMKRLRQALQTWCYRRAVAGWRVSYTVEGEELVDGPALIVSNHCSYIDIALLGALGAMRFTPKSDVRNWPVLGTIPVAFDVIFVDRRPGTAKKSQRDMHDVLEAGERLCVFPEGTTNNGRELMPFKPTLFHLAETWQGETPLKVQPVTIRYLRVNGKPLDVAEHDALWDKVAWYGASGFIPHLWELARQRRIEACLHCHPPITLAEGEGRKQLAERSREAVASRLAGKPVENA